LLLGATAIEDRLQDGVPEAITQLMSGGIKIWVLTGDKMETAINVGFLCGLLNTTDTENENSEGMILILVRDCADEKEVRRQLEMTMSKFWTNQDVNANYANRERALIIDGQSLKYALETESNKELLLEIACRCKAVICCRVSPLQKAQVVEMVKHGKKVMTLAIGDGANDVSMIQVSWHQWRRGPAGCHVCRLCHCAVSIPLSYV
jgi:phospholipid-translocating ATPase